jgi:AMP-activated protein kinase-like protein
MTDENDEMRPASGDDIESLSVAEKALVATLRAPAVVDAGAFDARVMAAVRSERSHGAVVLPVRRGRVLGVVTACAALAAALTFMFISNRGNRSIPVTPAPATAVASQVAAGVTTGASRPVRFTLVTSGASRVSLAGSFNGWNKAATPLRRVDRNTWTADIPLRAGRYAYQFVIDGTRWVPDPRAPRDAGDDFGATNSVVTVATSGSA